MTNKPIYIIIYDKLKSAIKGGTYPPGSFLPTEQELETLYQVSRTTIRRAVKLLSDEGILSVRQGCGTMVMDIRTTQNYNQVTSVTESLRKRGYDVTTGSMMIDVIPASRDIAADLFIPEGTPVARIQRLQLADGRPVTLMENYIEYAKVPGIEQHSGHFVALYQFFRRDLWPDHRCYQGPYFSQICRFLRSPCPGNRTQNRSFSDPAYFLLSG